VKNGYSDGVFGAKDLPMVSEEASAEKARVNVEKAKICVSNHIIRYFFS